MSFGVYADSLSDAQFNSVVYMIRFIEKLVNSREPKRLFVGTIEDFVETHATGYYDE